MPVLLLVVIVEEKRPVGRPSKYKDEYCEQAYKLCLLGATDKQIADFFDIDVSTLGNWKNDHPEFLESLKGGKENADAEIAKALFHRAKGYSHQAIKMFNNQGVIVSEEYTEHYPPDTTAAIFWLKNRQPKQWRDKQEIDHQSSDGSMTPSPSVVLDTETVKYIASKLNEDC